MLKHSLSKTSWTSKQAFMFLVFLATVFQARGFLLTNKNVEKSLDHSSLLLGLAPLIFIGQNMPIALMSSTLFLVSPVYGQVTATIREHPQDPFEMQLFTQVVYRLSPDMVNNSDKVLKEVLHDYYGKAVKTLFELMKKEVRKIDSFVNVADMHRYLNQVAPIILKAIEYRPPSSVELMGKLGYCKTLHSNEDKFAECMGTWAPAALTGEWDRALRDLRQAQFVLRTFSKIFLAPCLDSDLERVMRKDLADFMSSTKFIGALKSAVDPQFDGRAFFEKLQRDSRSRDLAERKKILGGNIKACNSAGAKDIIKGESNLFKPQNGTAEIKLNLGPENNAEEHSHPEL